MIQITDELLDSLPSIKKAIDLELSERLIIYFQVYQEEIFSEILKGDPKIRDSNITGLLMQPGIKIK